MIDRNADTPEDKRIRFRIGVNLGDVIVEQNDLFGDVNLAARLEALAEPAASASLGWFVMRSEPKRDPDQNCSK